MKGSVAFLLLLAAGGLKAQETARILDQTTAYTLYENGDAEISDSYRIQINSELGKEFAVYYDYFDKFRKISDVTVDVYSKTGERIKHLKRSDALEFGFNPSYEINDAKILFIDSKYQGYPFVMHVTTTVKLNGYLSLPTWVPQERFHLAVDKALLTVTRPEGFALRIKEENIKGNTHTSGKKVISVYEVSKLPAVEEKIRYSDFYEAAPKVLISPDQFRLGNTNGSLASWNAFGDWFLKLNSEPYELTTETKAFLDSLDQTDKKEMIRDIYEFMQDKTRYVSIQMGIGGFKSLPTEEVEKYGYGDCKALTTYMKNMLDYRGLESNYILVRAGRDVPDVERDFPSNQFNHVFLGVPLGVDTLMIECTSQTAPTGYTGTFTDDRNVLWIAESKSQMIRSRVYSSDENKKESSINIELNSNGNAKVTYEVENKGTFFDDVMIYDAAPKEYIEGHNYKAFPYDDFVIKTFSYKQAERRSPTYKAHFDLNVNGLAKPIGQRLVINNVPSIPLSKYLVYDDLARFCSIKRGLTVTDDIKVVLPDGYWIYNLPQQENITTQFGQYALTTEFDGQIIRIKRTFTLYKGDYTKEQFDAFRNFHQQLEKIESRKLVLNSKT